MLQTAYVYNMWKSKLYVRIMNTHNVSDFNISYTITDVTIAL